MIRILSLLQNPTLRSQAALEFLTIYSWAFIVIIIMVSTLAYFGILRPSKILPERCIFNLAFECQAQSIKNDGTVSLKLKNGAGSVVNVIQANLAAENGASFGCAFTGNLPTNWVIGDVQELKWTNCNLDSAGLSSGEKAKLQINISYFDPKAGILYQKLAQGEFISTVIPGSSGGGGIQILSCSVSGTCSGNVLFKMSALQDAHAEIASQSNYNNMVCCTTNIGALGNSCISGLIVLKLSSDTDAHVEKNTQTNYPINVCLSSSPGSVACSYRQNSCNLDETCLATMSADTDAHVGDCVTSPFNNKICCKIA